MIKAKDGNVTFKGKGKELLADYATIGIKMREIMPNELVEAAVDISRKSMDEIMDTKEDKNNA